MGFFSKIAEMFDAEPFGDGNGKYVYLVVADFDEASDSFALKSIEDREGNPLDIDRSKRFRLDENGNPPDALVHYLSELTGEPPETIEYHINEDE
jgi:hypothetical protein